MLVRFWASRPGRFGAAGAGFWLAACSLVVGELPDPLPVDGPMAGDAGEGAGSSTIHQGGSGDAGARAQAGQGGASGNATGGSSSSTCDLDGDLHLARGKCGGDDCDDQDPAVSPDQMNFFAERQAHVDYDYDCNGSEEQEQKAAVVCPGVAVGNCPTETGFLKTLPACGEVGAWGTCQKTAPLNTCDEKVVDKARRMRCR